MQPTDVPDCPMHGPDCVADPREGQDFDWRPPEYRHLRYLANEGICVDCMEGNHEMCRHEGGYLDDEDNSIRCGCHLTKHALDNRGAQTTRPESAERRNDSGDD